VQESLIYRRAPLKLDNLCNFMRLFLHFNRLFRLKNRLLRQKINFDVDFSIVKSTIFNYQWLKNQKILFLRAAKQVSISIKGILAIKTDLQNQFICFKIAKGVCISFSRNFLILKIFDQLFFKYHFQFKDKY